jgi:addiction module HigA family antidote
MMMKREVAYPTPGEILKEEFLDPMGITNYRLAKETGLSATCIGEIVAGTRSITVETGLRLSKYLGTSDEFWTGLQLDFEIATKKVQLQAVLAEIRRFEPPHA